MTFDNYIPYNEISEITLLSSEEISRYNIKNEYLEFGNRDYWLRDTDKNHQDRALVITCGDTGTRPPEIVCYDPEFSSAIRPILKLKNPCKIKEGDDVQCLGECWTVVAPNIVLADFYVCDSIFGNTDYNKSAAKKELDSWSQTVINLRKYVCEFLFKDYSEIRYFRTKESLAKDVDFLIAGSATIYNAYSGAIAIVEK